MFITYIWGPKNSVFGQIAVEVDENFLPPPHHLKKNLRGPHPNFYYKNHFFKVIFINFEHVFKLFLAII